MGFFYKTLSFNSVLQLLTDVAIFLCLIHIFSTRSLKTKTLWKGRGLLGTWSNLLHFVSLIVFFNQFLSPCRFPFVSYVLYKANLISNQDLMSHFLDPFTFNDKPVIAMIKTAFLMLEFSSFYESWTRSTFKFQHCKPFIFTYIFILQDDIRA